MKAWSCLLQLGRRREILAHRWKGSPAANGNRVIGGGTVSRRFSLLAFVGAAVVVAALAAGYTGSARSAASVSPLPSSSCGPVVYKGSGSPDFIIASDLPLQGAIRHQTVEISRAMIWALAEKGWKAGSYKIGYQSCDDSTAQTGGWDTAKCATNAHLYANNKSVIGVLGTFNSGCAKIEVPVLNRASLAMVSPANTNPGLTKKWDVGEPQKYYPTGTRNYARVVATGAYISVAGEPPKALTGQGATFVKSFGKQIGTTPNPYAAYGAQAMQVMLQAVAKSGGQRAAATKSIFGISIRNGILGNFT